MADNASNRTAADVLRDLAEFFAGPLPDVDKLTAAEVDTILKRRAIDSKKSFLAVHDLIDEEIAASELTAARNEREMRLRDVKPISSPEKGIRERVSTLIATLNPAIQSAYWSKCESLPDSDLQSLYDDIMLLKKRGDAREEGSNA